MSSPALVDSNKRDDTNTREGVDLLISSYDNEYIEQVKTLKQQNKRLHQQNEVLRQQLAEQQHQAMGGIMSGMENVMETGHAFCAKAVMVDLDKTDLEFLGEGGNGKAYAAFNKLDGVLEVVKFIPCNAKDHEGLVYLICKKLKEAKMHKRASMACPETVVLYYGTLLYIAPHTPDDNPLATNSLSSSPAVTPAKAFQDVGRRMAASSNSPESELSTPTHRSYSEEGRKALIGARQEKCDCDLIDHLEETNKDNPPKEYFEEAFPLLLQVTKAVPKLMKAGIYHNDLQGKNILIKKAKGTDASAAKITDFGICGDEDVQRDEDNEMLRGLGFILFEVLNEILSSDDAEYEKWSSGMINKEVPGNWTRKLLVSKGFEKDLCDAISPLFDTVRKAITDCNIESITVDGFKDAIETALEAMSSRPKKYKWSQITRLKWLRVASNRDTQDKSAARTLQKANIRLWLFVSYSMSPRPLVS